MLSLRKHVPVLFSLISLAVLVLSACAPGNGGQAPALATSIPPVPVTGQTVAPIIATAVAPVETAVATVVAGATSSIPETVTPSVTVADQPVVNDTVTVAKVVSAGPGWIVIHINSSGTPGAIIGWTQVNPGVNSNVVVKIDTSKATPVLYAMLHTDAGTVGTYEFPGADVPVMLNGQMVSPAFGITGGLSGTSAAPVTATTAASGPVTVNVATDPKLGAILVDSKGMTLYTYKKDTPGVSNCSGGCAENWPPLLVTTGSPAAGAGVTGTLASFARTDNGTQVTYNGMPLYYFIGDKAPGDVKGQGVGNLWFAATVGGATPPATTAPSGSSASGPATVQVVTNAQLGKILVDSKGMTLYVFKKDTTGVSNCNTGCVENWPPLLLTSGSPVAGSGATGTLATITRSDNGVQVTYNGMPLYYFAADKAAGDVNGQGVGNVWFAATP
jgi:predicted lipoprotein with Yx(FWY)xxD motif